MLEVYDCSREELRIGPFSYEPMRAVDIWLQQGDDFLLQSLSSSPEVAPPLFVPNLRTTLRRIKDSCLQHNQHNIRHSLPMDYSASIDREKQTWTGTARVPGSYFPPDVTRWNAYAIHGTDDSRT